MPICTRKGCGKEYDVEENTDESCMYHPGGPVFHEGAKSWSCCSDINKPVLEFDQFMKILGCTQGAHTDAAVKPEVPKSSPTPNIKMTESSAGTETYTSGKTSTTISPPLKIPAPLVEEEEDLDAEVPPGTLCRHNGCGTVFVSDALSRTDEGDGSVCIYHPAPPLFHEGSKGYLCCKRRVLEFDEFLKIEGCKKGRHLFVPKGKLEVAEQFVECRIDHYQTPSTVHVSVFAKQADKDRSFVKFEEEQIHFDLYLPQSKRFRRSLNLYGPIDTESSSFTFFGTKVEIILRKRDTRSWNLLERTNQDLGSFNLTFGVGGRTGTIGGKQLILDEGNKARE